MAQRAQTTSRLRRISLTVSPESTFPVPVSDGYSVYSALLGVFDNVDENVSTHVHDSPLGSLHNSGLQGDFGSSDRSHHKTLRAGEEYELALGIVDSEDTEIFQALVSALVLEGDSFELTNGVVRIESFESENATHRELLERAAELDDPAIGMDFRTATCIEEADGVTTAFPYRWSVFNSLVGKWVRSCSDDLELELDREAVLGSVIEKPDVGSLDTHSVLVNRVENEDGRTRNLFLQGFSGRCTYEFKNASEAIENGVTALALFGEYSGVGSAVARGCGSVEVSVSG